MTHNFKVGDKVVDNKGTLWEVIETEDNSGVPYHCRSTEGGSKRFCWFRQTGKAYTSGYYGLELVGLVEADEAVKQPSNKAHKHKDLIIAWANGAEIESFDNLTQRWYYTDRPVWGSHTQYRIKPEQKPDVVKYVFVEAKPSFCNTTNDNN